jgi:hypothetical protein
MSKEQELISCRGTEVDESQPEAQSSWFLGSSGGGLRRMECILSVTIPLHQMRRNMDEYSHFQLVRSAYSIWFTHRRGPAEIPRSRIQENTDSGSSEPVSKIKRRPFYFSFLALMPPRSHSLSPSTCVQRCLSHASLNSRYIFFPSYS